MNINNFFYKYNFHDSIIDDIKYLIKENKLIISLELCNWMQTWYKSSEPEMLNGDLKFYNVFNYKINEDICLKDASILDINIIDIKNKDIKKIEIFLEQAKKTIVITFETNKVEWIENK